MTVGEMCRMMLSIEREANVLLNEKDSKGFNSYLSTDCNTVHIQSRHMSCCTHD